MDEFAVSVEPLEADASEAKGDVEPILGAHVEGTGVRFAVFASPARACAVRRLSPDGSTVVEQAMRSVGNGYFETWVGNMGVGALYKFVVDGRVLNDPCARFLPSGVHGPAQVTAANGYAWRNGAGVSRPLSQHVIYELHVGTFSESGTYDGVGQRLPYLADLGVTAIELLPIGAFAGQRGWGYDGVALFAPFAPYGTPDDLRRLIDDAHGRGLAVFLDVVYNHFGPAGNYLPAFCPDYFSATVCNAWGDAPNYAHPVLRRMVLDNARYWLSEFRFDGLRLDATHAMIDCSSTHILRELTSAVANIKPDKLLIAEDNRNDEALVVDHGLHAIWADDFHHQTRVTLTGERDGYYGAYQPGTGDLARTIERGWLFEGQFFAPHNAPRGKPADRLEASAFVYCIQNHDQIGNRAFGDRLSAAVSDDDYRAVSMLLLFLPMTPLLFMGQEWAASTPFLFFTDHDEELGRQVVRGRREEFAAFAAFADPAARARIPDPQAPATFASSRLAWAEREQERHASVQHLYRKMLRLRASDPVLRACSRRGLKASAEGDVLVVRRSNNDDSRLLVLNFSDRPVPLGSLPAADEARAVLLRSDGGCRDLTEVGAHAAAIFSR
jgi:maltooligosyltrehalose trehalohydrolase